MNNQDGFALPLVLGIAVLLTVIVFSISETVSHRIDLVTDLDNQVRAEMKSYSAFNLVLYAMLTARRTPTALVPVVETGGPLAGHPRLNLYGEEIALNPDVSLRLRDTAGMISPHFDSAGLRRFFTKVLDDPDRAAQLADGLADWRDADDFRRLNGAESWDYRAAGLRHQPRNAPVQALNELLLIKGFDPELLDKISNELVYWHPGNVNYLTMSPELLAVFVPDQEQLAQVLARRDEGALNGPLFAAITGIRETEVDFFWPSSLLWLEITARHETGRDRLQAVVASGSGREKPFTILEWRR